MFNDWDKKANVSLTCIMLLTAVAVMAGCASPAKKACLQKDWQQIAYDEASKGRLASHSTSQRDACTQEGAPPDMKLFDQGRRQGLEKYCTADNGYAIGVKDEPYHGVCPPELKGPFIAAYQKGLHVYAQQLEKDIDKIEQLQAKMRVELTGVEEEIDFLEKEITAAAESQMRLRMGMISEMTMLERDQQSLTLQIGALEMDLKEMRERLSKIRSPEGVVNK